MPYWIGRVEPSMYFEGAFWQAIVPQDVRLGILSLGVKSVGVQEEMERAHSQILSRVELLDQAGMDVINVGGSPVVTLYGKEGHAKLLEDIAKVTSKPFVTSMQAEIEGIRTVSGGTPGRVVIASPYPTPSTEKRIKTLEEEGIPVLGHMSLEIHKTREIAELDSQVVFDLAVEVYRRHPEADVIYVPNGSFPAPMQIGRIEDATGKPVVTNVQSQATACLKRINYPRPVSGFGRLMETISVTPIPELAAT